MCRFATTALTMSDGFRDSKGRGGSEKSGSKCFFYTMQRISTLASSVNITSMLYFIYRLMLLIWV
ncbi:unnamed protein product [Staurois parvus]|uniref:Uncharacterized protein n=1 Tax=Staurois parvus TaxID=386267 RepID=A0ABN9E6M1_9NEOB|nr:unnamed protein product [Staurois parvus]